MLPFKILGISRLVPGGQLQQIKEIPKFKETSFFDNTRNSFVSTQGILVLGHKEFSCSDTRKKSTKISKIGLQPHCQGS